MEKENLDTRKHKVSYLTAIKKFYNNNNLIIFTCI